MGVAAADYSGDGLDDLFVTNSRGQLHAAYESRAVGPFADARPEFSAALGQRSTGWGATWVDLDLDGSLELALANGAIPVTNLAANAERLQVVTTATPDVQPLRVGAVAPRNGRGLAAADFDNDGDLDLALGSIGGRLQLLRNDGATGHWLEVALPRFSPGARVTVALEDGRRLSREARAGCSYLSSEDPRLHFGLGDTDANHRGRRAVPGRRGDAPGGRRGRPARAREIGSRRAGAIRSGADRGARGRHGRSRAPRADAAPVDRGAHARDALAGQAFTVEGRPSEHGDWDAAIRKTLAMLGAVPEGHVAVYQCNHERSAHFGELSATSLASRGVAGCVIDGGCRDVRLIESLGFPVFARFVTPEDSTWRWEVTATQVPVTIGTVRVEPGDWVVGDEDGVVVVPAAGAEQVLARGGGEGRDGEPRARRGSRRDDPARGVRAVRDVLARLTRPSRARDPRRRASRARPR